MQMLEYNTWDFKSQRSPTNRCKGKGTQNTKKFFVFVYSVIGLPTHT